MLLLDAIIVLAAIVIGVRKGGMALPLTGFAGLAILAFFCGVKPSSPPYTVMMIIFAVTSLGGCLQCAGGLDYLIDIAGKILRRNPNRVTLIAPIIGFTFVVCTGTAQVCMALLPVISEVARNAGLRPERPLSASCVAAAHGISASPLSASTAALIGVLANHGVNFGQMMMVLIPSILLAVIIGSLSVYKRGAELADDPEFQRRVREGEIAGLTEKKTDYIPTPKAKLSVFIFVISILMILIFGSFNGLMPTYTVNGKTSSLSIAYAIETICLTAGAIMIYTCGINPKKIAQTVVLQGGVYAVMMCFGIAFLTDSFFTAHKAELITIFGDIVQQYPWLFAVGLMIMGAILMSQGAATVALMPIGVALGIPAPYLVAMAPGVCTGWILPAHPSLMTAVAIDVTGTTTLGKWIFDHSAQRPGLVMTISSIAIGFVMINLVF